MFLVQFSAYRTGRALAAITLVAHDIGKHENVDMTCFHWKDKDILIGVP